MNTSEIIYLSELRTEMLHVKSQQKVVTDAPTDNQGKGEAFSPTDLVSAALCSCMMTIMGQVAQREGIPLEGLKGEVVKVMQAQPRKIAEIKIVMHHASLDIDDVQRQKLIRAARTCPVALSLDPGIIQSVKFDF